MRRPESKRTITREQYDAVLLDLDGVITDTASLHAACWKQMFDEYLQKHAMQTGEAFRPFDVATDYRLYVDGKPRFDGVRDFLRSRELHLPEGSPDDPPQAETVGGLGNRKNELINKVIQRGRGRAVRGKRSPHPSTPRSRVQNRRRHLKSKLRYRPEGRSTRCFLRDPSRWSHDPCTRAGREACPRYVPDGGKAVGGRAGADGRHRGCHLGSPGWDQWATSGL